MISAAIGDAIAWREHHDRPCAQCTDDLCPACTADFDIADSYHALARALGALDDLPPGVPAELAAAYGRRRFPPGKRMNRVDSDSN
jgi:hypothetical protein